MATPKPPPRTEDDYFGDLIAQMLRMQAEGEDFTSAVAHTYFDQLAKLMVRVDALEETGR